LVAATLFHSPAVSDSERAGYAVAAFVVLLLVSIVTVIAPAVR